MIVRYLGGQPRWFVLTCGFLLVLLIGVLDYSLDPNLLIFYLIPILLVARFEGKADGIVISVFSSVVWLGADIISATHSIRSIIPYWNMVMELGVFLTVTYAISALLASRKRQEELTQFIIHDLRSPLSNVLAGLQTLRSSMKGSSDKARSELVEISLVSANRMTALIDSLLDMSRLESSKLPLEMGQFNVSDLIDSSFEQVGMWAKRSQVTLKNMLNDQEAIAYADPSLTLRVLVNLLNNAIKYSPRHSEIEVYAALHNADTLAISVSDQGPGIPPEWADKIFDKYAQLEARKQGTAVGSGLGLTFCEMAVKAQGGRIWLNSEVKKGTTVTFTLPIKQPRREHPG